MADIYVETSVWGMVTPGQNPSLQKVSLEFLDLCESRIHIPHISEIVIEEIRQAPDEVQRSITDSITRVGPTELPMLTEADELAKNFIDQGILPERRMDDARHVACAMINEMDILVSWNYRHIANIRKADQFNAVAVLFGLSNNLSIHTPLEVLE